MPELPEVESARQLAIKCLEKRCIKQVKVCEGGDPIVFCGYSEERIIALLLHRVINCCMRKGKYIWFKLDRAPHVVFHFGMTGAFVVKGETTPTYKTIKFEKNSWPPQFWKLQLVMEDDTMFSFVNVRRLGRVRFSENPEEEPVITRLGFDPLLDTITDCQFFKKFSRKQCPIKAALLDQSVVAGVGNWIADEVLYQCHIHPQALCSEIRENDFSKMKYTLRNIIEAACSANANAQLFPEEWLFHYRWIKNKTRHSTAKDFHGHEITFSTVAGRTTATVLHFQRKHGVPKTRDSTEAAFKKYHQKLKRIKPPALKKSPHQASQVTN